MFHDAASHRSAVELIAATPTGAIERCLCCRALHLRFGNALLRLRLDGLMQFHYMVRSHCSWLALDRSSPSLEPNDRAPSAEIQMGNSGVGFTFRPSELYELDALMRQAMPRLIDDLLDESPDGTIPPTIQ